MADTAPFRDLAPRRPRLAGTAAALALGLAAALPLPAAATAPAAARAAAAAPPADPAALCEAAALRAARRHGVPADLMQAVALAESGRARSGRLRPWPWTVNAGGTGHWFATREAAAAFLAAETAAGRRSLDIGCFQINLRWHGHAFPAPSAMLDPDAGAAHAARFLARLAAETGSWEAAAGAYHSRTPERAARYRARVAALRARLSPDGAPGHGAPARTVAGAPAAGPATDAAAEGSPPARGAARAVLLAGGQPAGPGSLVPARAAGPSLLSRAQPLLGPRPIPPG